jgi:hypothetical protein
MTGIFKIKLNPDQINLGHRSIIVNQINCLLFNLNYLHFIVNV